MKQKETVWFDDKKYKERARNMSPDALWIRQCLKHRKKVSSGVSLGFAGLLVLPIGLWISGRTLDIARRKEKIIDNEVKRRNLPSYDVKIKDTLIPLGVSMTIGMLTAALDLFFLGGASSTVASSDMGIHTLGVALGQDPHAFLTGVQEGFDSHLEQQFVVLFHHGSDALQQPLGVSVDHAQSFINPEGIQHLITAQHAGTDLMQGNSITGTSALPPPTPSGNTLSTTQLMHHVQLAQETADVHTSPAISNMLAAKTAVIDHHVAQTLAQNSAAAAAAQAAGAQLGSSAVGTGEKKLIRPWGLDKLFKSSKVQKQGHDDVNIEHIDPNAIENMAVEALTGTSGKLFRFFTRDGQAMTQRIFSEPRSGTEKTDKRCRHEYWDREGVLGCKFCGEEINDGLVAYYHCCDCGIDVCEVCVAGRGCGCERRADGGPDGKGHILYRKGNLLPKLADLSVIEPLKVKVKKTKEKSRHKSDPVSGKEADLDDDCSIVLEKAD